MRRLLFPSALLLAALLAPRSAAAHVDVRGPGFAGQRQILEFTVGHGCTGADTVSVEIQLPSSITSVRALPWEFGHGEVITDGAGLPTAVRWTKTAALSVDTQFYTVAMRVTVPDAPFTTIHFPATQVCRAADGTETTVEWIETTEGGTGERAPALFIMPVRHPGWNRFTVPAAITDLSIFDDAEIVWQGSSAYSSNPVVVELIESDPTVDMLTMIAPGSDVWVRW